MVIPPILVFCFYHTPFDAKPQEAISTSCDFAALCNLQVVVFTVLFDSLNGIQLVTRKQQEKMLLKRTKNAAFEVIFSKVAFSQLFTVKPYIFCKKKSTPTLSKLGWIYGCGGRTRIGLCDGHLQRLVLHIENTFIRTKWMTANIRTGCHLPSMDSSPG